jgi:hypothetical protein
VEDKERCGEAENEEENKYTNEGKKTHIIRKNDSGMENEEGWE